ncbi:endo-1,3-alpha-glucanase family glycosylhydrolase [Cryobacterium sp. TMT3-29-2]|uniref:endo-1,3-alpha-glucanase family glycosylhydrolase n=1 Tax=Cryobacterium sp. TMT3-29-2 TaxID=2555867 RepID=UPI001073C3BE|nr:endo-1,3-alpha-glucanase family glycosylhydrolase [Cryobacterium sp. TMT3-29-2]TFC83432.1 DNRLRE domain-containing protein [Cryobacterium sp. TMT3-29-2]
MSAPYAPQKSLIKSLNRHTNGKPRITKLWQRTAVLAATVLALSAFVPLPASAVTSPQAVVAAPIAVKAAEATWTTIREPSTPHNTTLYVSATSVADKTFLKFDTAQYTGMSVVSATLDVKVASTTSTAPGVQVYPASSAWSASTLTEANRPAHSDQELSGATVRALTGQTMSVPLSGLNGTALSGSTAFEVRYAQKFVSTSFVGKGEARPTLRLVLAAPGSTPGSTPGTAPGTAPGSATGSDNLSFAVPGANTTGKKVFAHYFPPYPISIENKAPASDYYAINYLTAPGEGGIHANYGGLLRDRPEGRAPLPGDWKLTDMKKEVTDAADAGIDGFTVDIMSLSGLNWERTLDLVQGAEQSGRNFTIVPNLDMTASAGKASIATIAAKLAELYKSPATYRLSTGEFVLSSFAAERQNAVWWGQLKSTLASQYGIKTAFIAVFLNASDENLKSFAPISYALSNWGTRTPVTIENGPDYAAKARALGVKWMSPVAVQDVRPRSYLYDEAGNTETLKASWKRALSNGSELVQLVTWNDYSEGTSFAPSAAHGEAFLDINAYYLSQFKEGSAPAIVKDSIYVTHRIQPYAATPTTPQQLMSPTLSGTAMKPRDTVGVLTFLTAPATVTVSIGGKKTSFEAPAGESSRTFPLALGTIGASADRNGAQIAAVTSPYPVVARPVVQDLQYYAASSRTR